MSHNKSNIIETSARLAAGFGLAGAAVIGGLVVADHAEDLNHRIVVAPESARPSDSFSEAFDAGVTVFGAIGVGALALGAGRKVRETLDPKAKAIGEISRKTTNSSNKRRVAASASLIATGAAVMAGSFWDIASEVGASQTDVSNTLFGGMQGNGETFVLSNSPTPELATATNVAPNTVTGIIGSAQKFGITVAPARAEWHTTYSEDGSGAKAQILAAGLPQEVTGLPSANETCTDVPVSAAEEIGVKEGETLTMDGLTLTVRNVLTDSSGINLMPVILNNDDFARCVQTNPDQPYTFMLARGEREQVDAMLKDAGISAEDLSNRIFVIPEAEFMANTLQTGKNNVNSLALQSMAVAMLFAGAALGNKSGTMLANHRQTNAMYVANGLRKKQLGQIYKQKADREALTSSLIAAPMIVLVDAFTNNGTPGAALGPNAGTFLCVLGATWVANRAGTALAVRREIKNIDLAKGHRL